LRLETVLGRRVEENRREKSKKGAFGAAAPASTMANRHVRRLRPPHPRRQTHKEDEREQREDKAFFRWEIEERERQGENEGFLPHSPYIASS